MIGHKGFRLSPVITSLVLAFCAISALAAPAWVKGTATISNALAGGSDNGKAIPICRAKYERGTHPGRLTGGKCSIGYGGKEVSLAEYEVLTGLETEVAWVASKNGEAVNGAIAAGTENNRTMAICRFKQNNTLQSGKVAGTSCNIGVGGKEATSSSYEVLADASQAAKQPTAKPIVGDPPAIQGGKLAADSVLESNQKLFSANKAYYLYIERSGRLGIFDSVGKRVQSIETGATFNHPLKMNKDGSVSGPFPTNHSAAVRDSTLILNDDGELVIRTPVGYDMWSSKDDKAYERLIAGQAIRENQMIRSENGEYFAKQQSDGNLLVIKKSGGATVWSSNVTFDRNERGRGMYLTMLKDGNLAQYRTGLTLPKWSTDTKGNDGAYAMVTNDGKLLVKSKSDAQLWPLVMGSTLKSGDKLMQSQTLMSDNGSYRLTYQFDRNFVLYDAKGKALWSQDGSGVFNGDYVQMRTDGELGTVSSGHISWSAGKFGAGAFLKVTDIGDVVVFASDGKTVKWSARGMTK